MGWRAELKAACIALKDGLDTALEAVGLPPLEEMVGDDPEDTGRLRLPRCVVSLAGPRTRTAYTPGLTYEVEERLTAAFRFDLDGDEDDALAVEDAVAPVLDGAFSAVKTAVTSGALGEWYPAGGDLGLADGGDATQWSVVLTYAVMVEG